MKTIIFTIVLAISVSTVFAQTYNMKIKQGTVTVYSQTSTVDEITFDNTTNFTCGSPILYGGDLYTTVLIGSQCWFQKNLNYGSRVSGSSHQTDNSIIEKYCYGDLDATCITYGGLYQWAETVQYQNGATNTTSTSPPFTGNVQGICPNGWHIPTLAEFTTLQTTLGGSSFGNLLKAVGQGTGSGEGSNISGFSALLAGGRYNTGNFFGVGEFTIFWSSSEFDATTAYYLYLSYYDSYIDLLNDTKGRGYSVRCLKD